MELWHDIPVPNPGPEIRGGNRSSRPLDKGGRAVSKEKISALRASVWFKNKGGPQLDPPLHILGKQNKQAKEVYWPYGCYPILGCLVPLSQLEGFYQFPLWGRGRGFGSDQMWVDWQSSVDFHTKQTRKIQANLLRKKRNS